MIFKTLDARASLCNVKKDSSPHPKKPPQGNYLDFCCRLLLCLLFIVWWLVLSIRDSCTLTSNCPIVNPLKLEDSSEPLQQHLYLSLSFLFGGGRKERRMEQRQAFKCHFVCHGATLACLSCPCQREKKACVPASSSPRPKAGWQPQSHHCWASARCCCCQTSSLSWLVCHSYC